MPSIILPKITCFTKRSLVIHRTTSFTVQIVKYELTHDVAAKKMQNYDLRRTNKRYAHKLVKQADSNLNQFKINQWSICNGKLNWNGQTWKIRNDHLTNRKTRMEI